MPSADAIAACVAVGLDPACLGKRDPETGDPAADVISFTRWQPSTHPGCYVDFLTQNGVHYPVRVNKPGWNRPKSLTDGTDDGDVSLTWADVLFLPNNKVKVLQNIAANFPAVDPTNIVFSLSNGKVVVDLSAYTLAQQTAAKAKLLLTNFADKLTLIP